jgi:integrative and conjugative element protein (TIGR02256 family)
MLQTRPDLITCLPMGGYLIIPSKLIEQLYDYRQLSNIDTEAGGVLIGCWRNRVVNGVNKEPFHAELTDCTTPHRRDKRSRYGFFRRSSYHIKKVLQAWKHSSKEQSYIGEWHTHPEPHPKPSNEDIAQWQQNISGNKAILIIIGQKSNWIAYWDGFSAVPLPNLVQDAR